MPAISANATGAQSDLTVNELLLAYWRHAESYYVKDGRPTSELNWLKLALRPLRTLYGHTRANDFGPLALKTVREAMVEADVSRKVVNGYTGRIKRLFRWGVENELVSPSVYQALRAVSGLRKGRSKARETEPVGPVADAHVDAVQPHLSRHVWAMIEVQRLTGMRPGEVVMMRGRDLDITGELWLYRPSSHKMAHRETERVIDIGPKAQNIVKPFLKRDLGAYLFSPADAEKERNAERSSQRETPLYPSYRRRNERKRKAVRKRPPKDHYTTISYRRAITRACEKANVPNWSPNQLRHSFATRIRKQYGVETARIILGHTTAFTTEICAEADRARAAAVIREVG